MFNGLQIDFGSPAASVPVVDSHPIFEKLLEPRTVAMPSLADRLAEAQFEMFNAGAGPEQLAQAVTLIMEYGALEKRVEEFLSSHRSAQMHRLEDKRADLWKQCRTAEDEQKACAVEIAQATGRLNAHAQLLNEARSKAAGAVARPFNTKFPSDAELQAWNDKRAAVRSELSIHETRLQDLQLQVRFAEAARHAATEKLREAIEALRAADAALAEYKKK
jgi:chromosome segregation ATPase